MQNQQVHQMCATGADFKRFPATKAKTLRFPGNVSSIMRTKLLSIMRAKAAMVSSP